MHLKQKEETQYSGKMQVKKNFLVEGMFTSIQVTEKSSKKKTETHGNYELICDLRAVST